MENPYESPASDPVVDRKPYSRNLHKIAKSSWAVPLACLAVCVFIDLLGNPAFAFVAIVFFVAGTLLGLGFSIVGLARSHRYRRLIWHSLVGLVISGLFVVVIVFGIYVAIRLRQIQAKADALSSMRGNGRAVTPLEIMAQSKAPLRTPS